MADAVSFAARVGAVAETRRVDAAQTGRAAQEMASQEVRQKDNAAVAAASQQAQPSPAAANPRMEVRTVRTPVYVPETESGEAGESRAEAAQAAAAQQATDRSYATDNSASQSQQIERMSQMVRKLYDLTAA